jgi:phosphoglycerate dehydrogenase-like enzyme
MDNPPLRVVSGGELSSDFLHAVFEGRIRLSVARTDADLAILVREAEVLYSWKVPDSVPSETPYLRWVQLPSAGVDHIRGLPVWESAVILTTSSGIHTAPMSEHLFAMLLALTRRIPEFTRAQERHEWIHERPGAELSLGELRGKTMGIVGWGRIGDGVAHLARSFGMRVVGTKWSVMVAREAARTGSGSYSSPPFTESVDLAPDIVYPSAQLHEVLAQSDVVVAILPLTGETRGLFKDSEFQTMKQGAIFCNIGRGPVVDQDALVRALRKGRLRGAGLDVFAQEPLPSSSPLWSMKNVIVSPHVGGVGDRTYERAVHFFRVNLERYLDHEPLLNVVDRNREY